MESARARANGSTAPSPRCPTRAMSAPLVAGGASNGDRSVRIAAVLTRWRGGHPPGPLPAVLSEFWQNRRVPENRSCQPGTRQAAETARTFLGLKPMPSRLADILFQCCKLLRALGVGSFLATIALI